MGRHSIPGPDDFSDQPFDGGLDDDSDADYPDQDSDHDAGGGPDHSRLRTGWGELRPARRGVGQWRGGHRSDGGRREISFGVIAALVGVIVVVGAVIAWRFFGDTLSHRSDAASERCVNGKVTVAVIADPSIADQIQEFADRFNGSAKPVGDRCVAVSIKPADSDAVINGFIGDWPAGLGERPALWVPGSSVSAARLQAVTGKQTVSDSRSLVTSPVLLALRPKLKSALDKQDWGTLPGLQSHPDTLAELGLPGWGSLRLALPISGNSDATFLAAEAVAAASAPHGADASAGTGAVHTLVGAQPELADDSVAEAMNTLLRPGDRARAPVHAVVTTEQQVFARGQSLSDAGSALNSWLPPGPAAVADYPTVLLSGSWLSQEQVSAASEFARFSRKADQLADLANAGFRVEGVAPPSSDVTGFAALPSPLSLGDDTLRASLANALTPRASQPAVTIMLDQSMTVEEGGNSRLDNVIAALNHRIAELPPKSAVGLWVFDGVEGHAVIPAGPLADQVDGQPRTAALRTGLDRLSPTSGGAVSFTTLRLVYTDVLANYREGQANSVLVITASPHTDRTLDGPGLQDFIRQADDPSRPVAVNVIDFGDDSDRETWRQVAALSGGSYQNLANSNSPELAIALMTFLS